MLPLLAAPIVAPAAPAIGAGIAASVATVVSKLSSLKAIADKAGNIAGKLGLGGVTDDRFIRWRDTITDNYLKGYPEVSFSQYKIDHASVPNKKSDGTYSTEYNNLRKYIIARLNKGNAGLGDLWGKYFPEIKMYDQGGPIDQPFQALKLLTETYKPGTYRGELTLPANVTPQQYSDQPDLTKSALPVGSNKIQGLIDIFKQRKNDSSLQANSDNLVPLKIAGFDGMTVLVILVLIVLGTYFAQK